MNTIKRLTWMVDSGAWLAYFDVKDDWNKVVTRVFRELANKRAFLCTTDGAILELIMLMRRRRHSVDWVVERIRRILEEVEVFFTSRNLLEMTMDKLLLRSGIELSGVDAAIWSVMSEQGIQNILTVDEHFIKLGVIVRPDYVERQDVVK